MIIFHIDLDSFKYGYSGYWTSLEKACEMLPQCKDFLRSLDFCKPTWYKNDKENVCYSPDYQVNDKIKPVLKPIDQTFLEVYLPGFKIDRFTEEVTPELKTPGAPYVPELRKKINLEPHILTGPICRCTVQKFEVDAINLSNY